MEEKQVYSVRLTLLSTLDGESTRSEYIGEYKQSDGKHTIVYTDYSGNTITKVGIEATENAMLIHRVGGYEGDMLFTTEANTKLNYVSFSLNHEFRLHTTGYELDVQSERLMIYVRYVLADDLKEPGITCSQKIIITKKEEAKNEESI